MEEYQMWLRMGKPNEHHQRNTIKDQVHENKSGKLQLKSRVDSRNLSKAKNQNSLEPNQTFSNQNKTKPQQGQANDRYRVTEKEAAIYVHNLTSETRMRYLTITSLRQGSEFY